MKRHLAFPEDQRPMCGASVINVTEDPDLVTCKTCSEMHASNEDWYAHMVSEE